jgi:hypothetical protein
VAGAPIRKVGVFLLSGRIGASTSLNAEQRVARSSVAGTQQTRDRKIMAEAWLQDQIAAGRIAPDLDPEVLAAVARILISQRKLAAKAVSP